MERYTFKKEAIAVLLFFSLAILSLVVSCATAPVKPQSSAEALILAEAALTEANLTHATVTEQVITYLDAGVLTKEKARELLALLDDARAELDRAGEALDLARMTMGITSMENIENLTIPAARRIIRRAVVEMVRVTGGAQ